MLDLLFTVLVLIHSNTIGLGVGASTIAIAGFLTAIGDGTFDPSEKRIMGVVYFTLRVAMGTILVSSGLVYLMDPQYFQEFTSPMWILIAVLFINAVLMTKHWISGKFGPAIQAATWYTLGFLVTIYIFGFATVDMTYFAVFYAAALVVGIVIVNGCMVYLKNRREKAPQVPAQQ